MSAQADLLSDSALQLEDGPRTQEPEVEASPWSSGGPTDESMVRLQECYDSTTRLMLSVKEMSHGLMRAEHLSPMVIECSQKAVGIVKKMSVDLQPVDDLLGQPRAALSDMRHGLALRAIVRC